MNLGPLAFTADDFKCGNGWVNPALAHELANERLRERLSKTPLLHGNLECMVFSEAGTEPEYTETHTCQAVCFEVKK